MFIKVRLRRLFIVLFLFAVSFVGTPYSVFAFAGGSGTGMDPYQIATCNDVLDVDLDLSASYLVMNDLDCSSDGDAILIGESGQFSGDFDGGSHRMTVAISLDQDQVGLFGYVLNGSVHDLFINGTISGHGSTGGIIGYAFQGDFNRLASAVHVSSSSGTSVGGIIGHMDGGTLSNGNFTGTVSAAGDYVGGIGGTITFGATVSNVYSAGIITSAGESIGGIAGALTGTAENTTLNNSFMRALVIEQGSNQGAIAGMKSGSAITNTHFDYDFSNVLWNDSTPLYCNGTNTGGFNNCVLQNFDGTDSAYFVGNNTNDPLTAWDFYSLLNTEGIWHANDGTLPSLLNFTPPPLITGITVDEGSTAGGLALSITGVGLDATAVTFGGIDATILETTGDTSLLVQTPAHVAGMVPVVVTNTDGQVAVTSFTYAEPIPVFAGGDGSPGSPYQITSCAELSAIGTTYLSSDFILSNDLDCSEYALTMIGDSTHPYTGTFNGNGHKITVNISATDADNIGLFSYIGGGTVIDLWVAGTIAGRNNVGGIVGAIDAGSVLRHVVNSASIQAVQNNAGGIAGNAGGAVHIVDSYNAGAVRAENQVGGGIVGFTSGSVNIERVYSRGAVFAPTFTGGLVGRIEEESTAIVRDSFAVGAVSHYTGTNRGGILGTFPIATVTLANNFWDEGRTNENVCGYDISGDPIMTPVGICESVDPLSGGDLSQPLYFKNNFSNDPFNGVWDFEDVWGTVVDGYPELRNIENDNVAINDNSLLPFAGGDGSAEDPYQINTCEGVVAMNDNLSASYLLIDDVDCSGAGNDAMVGTVFTNPFTGTLDGGGYTVTLDIHLGSNYAGLFRQLDGTVTNITIGGTVESVGNAAGLAGYANNATLSYIHNNATIICGDDQAGGIVGNMGNGSITDSYNTGSVTGSGNRVGGIVGIQTGTTIARVYSSGAISGDSKVGGLIGEMFLGAGTITDSFSVGSVTGNSQVGGVVGLMNGSSLSSTYLEGTTSGQSDCASDDADGCTIHNANGLDAGHFQDTSTEAPMSAWDFDYVWQRNAAAYPTFRNPITTPPTDMLITSCDDLVAMKNNLAGSYVLTADLDCTANGNDVITGDISDSFTGQFDGNGHTLAIDISGAITGAGLFGFTNAAYIHDLWLEASIVNDDNYVGGLVGYANNETIIERVAVHAGITTGGYVGGIVGYLTGGSTISNSYASVTISDAIRTGGLAGFVDGASQVQNSYATGHIAGTFVGGVVGQIEDLGMPSIIENSFAAVFIEGASEETTGGILGTSSGSAASNLTYDFWDVNRSVMVVCANNDFGATPFAFNAGDCEVANDGGADPDYFKNNHTNAPFDTWDFTDIWNTNTEGYQYPVLRTITGDMGGADYEAAYTFAGGDGSLESPYIIITCAALQGMQDNLSASYILGTNVDCSDTANWNTDGTGGFYGFNPVGSSDTPFTGTLNGDGYNISGLYIQRRDETDVGLFGYTSGATVSDVVMTHAHILGEINVGGIIGHMDGGSLVSSSVNGTSATEDFCADDDTIGECVWARWGAHGGGLVGYLEDGLVIDSMVHGPVRGSGNFIGGLVGTMDDGSLVDCETDSNTDGGREIGGAIGNMYGGQVLRVRASGNAFVNEDEAFKQGIRVGGFIGAMYGGSISQSSAIGSAMAIVGSAGGFVGHLEGGSITDSYTTASVEAPEYVGGFAGYVMGGSVFNSYTASVVHSTGSDGDDEIGGFAGYVGESVNTIKIAHSFASATLTSDLGATPLGFIGQYDTTYERNTDVDDAEIDNVYFDAEIEGTIVCYRTGTGDDVVGSSEGGTECNWVNGENSEPAYFKNNNTNAPLDIWEFDEIWTTTLTDFPALVLSPYHGAEPLVVTGEVELLNNTYAVVANALRNTIDHTIIEIGTEFSTSSDFTDAARSSMGTETSFDIGSYSVELEGLTCNTLYYYRSYVGDATDDVRVYGDIRELMTTGCDEVSEAPEVISVSPEAGSIGASITTDIVVAFSQQMSPETVSVSVGVCTPNCPDYIDTWSEDGTTLTMHAVEGTYFDYNSDYTVTVLEAQNSDGVDIESEYTWAFTTESAPELGELVLTPIHTIPSRVKVNNAVYTFSTSEAIENAFAGETGDYEFDVVESSGGGTVSVQVDPDTHEVTFTGLEIGRTYSVSFRFITDDNESNTLVIGPFTVIRSTASSGGRSKAARARIRSQTSVAPQSPRSSQSSSPVKTANLGSFVRTLRLGMSGPDVLALQKFLNVHGFTLAVNGNGSLGHETSYFGMLTAVAIKKFQAAHLLQPDGIVGPKTWAALQSLAQ